MLLVIAIFVATILFIVGLYWFIVERPDAKNRQTIQRRLASGRATVRATTGIRRDDALSKLSSLERLLNRARRLSRPLHTLIQRSGVQLRPGAVVLACLLCAGAAYVLVWQFGTSFGPSLLVAGLAGFCPIVYLRRRAKQRMLAFEEKFPETIDVLSRSLRAGHSFSTALELVGTEAPEPIAGEFRRMFEYQAFGTPFDEALKDFANRVPLVDIRFFVTAVLTQHEIGGNLSELLEGLSSVIRERLMVKREIRVATAHGRVTGWVLAGMPVALAAVMFLVSPEHISLLFRDPLGTKMLYLALGLQAVGMLWIKRIMKIEY